MTENEQLQKLILQMLETANHGIMTVGKEVHLLTVSVAELKVEMKDVQVLREQVREIDREVQQVKRDIDSHSYIDRMVPSIPAFLIALAALLWSVFSK